MERTIERLEEALESMDLGSSYFMNPSFLDAIVGVTEDGSVVYRYTDMIESLVRSDGMDRIDAEEFIQFNTIRTIPYMPDPKPIILYELEDF